MPDIGDAIRNRDVRQVVTIVEGRICDQGYRCVTYRSGNLYFSAGIASVD